MHSVLSPQIAVHLLLSFNENMPMDEFSHEHFFSSVDGCPDSPLAKANWFSSVMVPLIEEKSEKENFEIEMTEKPNVFSLSKICGKNMAAFLMTEKRWPSNEDVSVLVRNSAAELLELAKIK
jgi:hypothetical protein